jgi:hypothetical protein
MDDPEFLKRGLLRQCFEFSFSHVIPCLPRYPRSEIGPVRLQKLGGSTLKEDIIRTAGLNFMDAEDAEELEFLFN